MQIAGSGITPLEASVTVSYEGHEVSAPAGVSVAAALTAAGIAAYRHAAAGDRGLFCGMGVCGECTIRIDGRPGQLACMTAVQDGMRLDRQPLTPEAALGSEPVAVPPVEELSPELLVVGAGPAGLSAAAAAAEAGIHVLIVDERAALGGQYYKQPASSFAVDPADLDAQYTAGRALIERVRASGATILPGTRVWGANGPHELYAVNKRRRLTIRPSRLVLATGAYERAVPFPGWTLPGVLTTGAGQSLLRAYQVAPGQRVLVAGNGPLNMQLAAELVRAGGTVAGLVELAAITHPRHAWDLLRMSASGPTLVRDGLGYLATLRRARVPVLTGRAVVRVDGVERVERAVVARIGGDGRPVPGSERVFDVDAVCIGLGFMPGNELARLLGAKHSVDQRTGGFVIDHTTTGRTSVPDVWVVGDGAAVRGAKVAQSAGTVTGADVVASLDRPRPDVAAARRHQARHERFQRALWRIYRGPALFSQLADADTIVCRCESIPLRTIDAATAEVGSAGALKRLTRAGMGRCQGRFCGFVVAERVAACTGTAVDAFANFAPQPPLRPTASAALAADAVNPARPG
jgi:NADPH-dependent 2,4-dienoyl-CoA reductase/sulfur reductase-like enzyme